MVVAIFHGQQFPISIERFEQDIASRTFVTAKYTDVQVEATYRDSLDQLHTYILPRPSEALEIYLASRLAARRRKV